MRHTFTNSSNIADGDYDEDTKTLKVRFLSGRTYSYVGVPESVAQEFFEADSPGGFLNQSIKNVYAVS